MHFQRCSFFGRISVVIAEPTWDIHDGKNKIRTVVLDTQPRVAARETFNADSLLLPPKSRGAASVGVVGLPNHIVFSVTPLLQQPRGDEVQVLIFE